MLQTVVAPSTATATSGCR